MNARLLSLAALAATFAACSSGGSDDATGVKTGGDFVVLKTEPLNGGRLFLNDPIRIDFSNRIELASADLNTVSFQVFDQNGNALSEQPAGRFVLDTSPGDSEAGRRLLFVPRFPTTDTYDDGGFRPGRRYLVRLVGGDRVNGTVLRDSGGKGLLAAVSFEFSTADGTTPAQLFRNRAAGGPRRTGFTVTPESETPGVLLNKFGAPPVEVRLTFDQPLNPHSDNVPVALSTNPVLRSLADRGRVFLEYDDPTLGRNTWIPADVELEVNDLERSVVLLRPTGVLPNNAEVRVIVENTLEDISGESNVANAAYSRVFATFRTRASYEPQFDAVVDSFRDASAVDFDAPFVEPQADVEAGFLKAGFQFEGSPTGLEFEPNVTEVVLNTNFTQVVPRNGVPFNVSGGVFNFRRVVIPDGVRVIGQGTNPMVWLVSGDFIVRGILTVRGGDGARVDTLNSANFPAAGGIGTCSGGAGGAGSPSGTTRDMLGATGFGPGQRAGGGGRGGRIGCAAGCGRGSGGGGGALATQGDPFYKALAGAGTAFQQQRGTGGQGCSGAAGAASRNLQGGESGPILFTDARADNNFWGAGVDINRQLRITGEIATPVGGGGGGGGGDLSNASGCNPNPGANFISDSKGGGGGGGGGALIVKALGNIIIEPTGKIIADGGHGGGGEQAGSCNEGGGGGAGAGGMVILMAGRQIQIHAHGTGATNAGYTYAGNNYNFAISADGGVTTTGTFGSPVVAGKYPADGQAIPTTYGTSYDGAPLGAFGGMGIVQLMAPSGDPDPAGTNHNLDSTNTVLDDNVVFFRNGAVVNGADKQSLLAWRGFPNASGVLVDDNNNPTNVGANEGDIRPAPVLLPVPFSSKTRLRSKWIDTGASKRRALTSADNQARGIVEDPANGFLAGPTYTFAGVRNQAGTLSHGYVEYAQTGGEVVRINYPAVLAAPAQVLRTETGVTFFGQAAHRIELTTPALGTVVDRYSQYEAEVLNASGTALASFRILAHSDRLLTVAAEDGALPDGTGLQLQVRAKFFKVQVNGSEGLGPTYAGFTSGVVVPVANVRIGFAFHSNPTPGGNGTRFPADPNQYVYDLSDPAVQEQIRAAQMSFVQWDVLFDTSFKSVSGDAPPALSPSSPRPELHFLRIPFRF